MDCENGLETGLQNNLVGILIRSEATLQVLLDVLFLLFPQVKATFSQYFVAETKLLVLDKQAVNSC